MLWPYLFCQGPFFCGSQLSLTTALTSTLSSQMSVPSQGPKCMLPPLLLLLPGAEDGATVSNRSVFTSAQRPNCLEVDACALSLYWMIGKIQSWPFSCVFTAGVEVDRKQPGNTADVLQDHRKEKQTYQSR